MIEIWKDIEGFEGAYKVSNFGNVSRCVGLGLLRSVSKVKDKDGYFRVHLSFRGIKKKMFVHRLVLIAFAGKSSLQVDHIDGNKQNNIITNLQWVTNRENQHRSNELKGHRSSKLRGVSWHKQTKMWQSELRHNNKRHYLGIFKTEEDAHLAYNLKLSEL